MTLDLKLNKLGNVPCLTGEPARTGGLGCGEGIRRFRDQARGHGRKAVRAGHVPYDQRLEAFLAGIGGAHVKAVSVG